MRILRCGTVDVKRSITPIFFFQFIYLHTNLNSLYSVPSDPQTVESLCGRPATYSGNAEVAEKPHCTWEIPIRNTCIALHATSSSYIRNYYPWHTGSDGPAVVMVRLFF